MTEAALGRIATNYELLAGRMQALTASFYQRLFEQFPQVRPLFRIDLELQSQHLAAALALMDVLEQPLMDLGAGHARAGVRPEHYPIVCWIMIEVLRDGSGEAWSPQLLSDWTDTLQLVSRMMMQGALRPASSSEL